MVLLVQMELNADGQILESLSYTEAIGLPNQNRLVQREGVCDPSNAQPWSVRADHCPKSVPILRSQWVCKAKLDGRRFVVCCKARLIADGHGQVHRVSFDAVWTSVVRMELVRIILAFACRLGLCSTSRM